MKKKETKHLIFDNPKKIDLKFFIKLVLSFLLSFFYKIKLNLIFPREKRNLKYNVSVCAIFKDEAKYLREWIEFHKIVGVEHFYLYNNFSTDDYLSVLTPYIDSGLVTLTDWPVMQGQMSAYRDCVEKFQNETQWIGFIDIDEFVCPNRFDKIGDFLEQFKKRPIVIVYWRYFGSSGILERDENSLVTESFFSCWEKYADIGKCFYNTSYDYAPDLKGNEWMHYRWGKYKNQKLPPVNVFDNVCVLGFNPVETDKMPIQINHYVVKSLNEYKEKSKKGDACFKENGHNMSYFYEHERKSQFADFHIFRYLSELKLNIEESYKLEKINGGGYTRIVFSKHCAIFQKRRAA